MPGYPGFEGAHIAEALVFRNPNELIITGADIQVSGAIGANPALFTFDDLRLTMNLAILFDGNATDLSSWNNFRLDPSATNSVTLPSGQTVGPNTVKISALSAALFPDQQSFFHAEVNPDGNHTTDNPDDSAWKGISGSLDLITGEVTLRAGDFHLLVENLLEVKASGISFHFSPSMLHDPTAEIATFDHADLFILPLVDGNGDPVSIQLDGLSIRGNGFTLGSATFTAGDLPPPAFDGLLKLDQLSVTVNNVVFNTETGFSAGGLIVSTATASFLRQDGGESLVKLDSFEGVPR